MPPPEPAAAPVPREGQEAPDLSLPSSDGRAVRLADLRGRSVVLFFYPRAATPG